MDYSLCEGGFSNLRKRSSRSDLTDHVETKRPKDEPLALVDEPKRRPGRPNKAIGKETTFPDGSVIDPKKFSGKRCELGCSQRSLPESPRTRQQDLAREPRRDTLWGRQDEGVPWARGLHGPVRIRPKHNRALP
jgi:hypothetical protein